MSCAWRAEDKHGCPIHLKDYAEDTLIKNYKNSTTVSRFVQLQTYFGYKSYNNFINCFSIVVSKKYC